METPNIPELCYQLVIDGAKKPNVMVIDIEPQAVERRPRYALRGEFTLSELSHYLAIMSVQVYSSTCYDVL